jgi:uncharacterized protein YlxW (UPF0749 family)
VSRNGGTRGEGLVLPAILLVLGFLVTAAVVHERAQERRAPERTENLVRLVRRRQAAVRDLGAQVRSLSEELAGLQEAGAVGSARVEGVVARVEGLRASAGLQALRGPGVVVELADSPDAPRTGGDVTDLRIQDVDLQLVVNALWASGAEAVAVNGHRVAGGTAIRQAGQAILVNFRAVSSPYRVTAIGDPEYLRRRLLGSEIARRFEVWTQVYGLEFAVGPVETVTLPGLPAPIDLAWARPGGGEEVR